MVVRHEGMAYFLQVKPRLTTWLMAALLVVTAAVGAPLSSVAAPCVSYGIVRVDAARRTQQSVSEAREAPVSPPPQSSPALSPTNVLRLGFFLERSLFQRPPPLALS
jgi:hypothetical protein